MAQTKRDYLASLTPPLAIPGSRGRFSKAGLAELARARSAGMVFTDDEPSKVEHRAEATEPAPYVPMPIRSKPVLRNIKKVSGFTIEGHLVEQGACMRCTEHVARCDCPQGIAPSRIIVRWSDESAPYGESLAEPART